MTTLRDQRGYTLMEMALATAMLGVITISSTSLFQSFNRAFLRLPMAMDLRTADRATDLLVARIQQADASSVNWSQIYSTDNLLAPVDQVTFERSSYRMDDPTNPVIQQIRLAYNASRRAIEETITGISPVTAAQSKVVLSEVDPPTTGTPLFSQDITAENLIVIQIMIRLGPENRLRVVTRRVMVK